MANIGKKPSQRALLKTTENLLFKCMMEVLYLHYLIILVLNIYIKLMMKLPF